MGALMDIEGLTRENNLKPDPPNTTIRNGSDDKELTLEPIDDPNGWLTDEVITRYFRYLTERNRQWDSNMVFLSPHFYNRLVDMSSTGPVIRSHIQSALSGEPSQEAYLELDALQAMHEDMAIFNYSKVYIPVRRPEHWSLLEIDNRTRTITYLDSLYLGGAEYIRPLDSYLRKLEEIRTQELAGSWQWRTTTFGRPRSGSQVCVPKQTNGNDCGVYVCCIADLLEREQDITLIRPTHILHARRQLLQSMVHQSAIPLIAEDAGRDVSPMDVSFPALNETDIVLQTPHVSLSPDEADIVEVTNREHINTKQPRSSRNTSVDYREHSPKKCGKLRRLRNIKPDRCKLAIGSSQQ
jgi:hypothetical protein